MAEQIGYNKEVMKRFTNPKHYGEMKNPDGVGEVGNPQCLLPEEKIFLNGEFKDIKSADKNDLVISHDSSINKIKEKFSREFRGNIINLKNCMGNISLTPEHLLFALKLPKHYDFFRTKNKQKLIPAWYHAEDLEKRDIIIYPINKEIKEFDYLDIDIPKLKYDFKSKNIPKTVPLNSELLRLFGYFIAEGNIQDKPSKTYISFGLNIDEKDIVEDIRSISKKLFNLEIKIQERPKTHAIVVYLYNAQLARFFKKLFGNGAENKKLPEFIMKLPIEKQKSLIKGFWKGDGHINLYRTSPRAGYVTISYQFAQQIKTLLLRQKIIPSIYKEKERIVRGVNHKASYRIHVGQRDSLIKLSNILGIKYSPKSFGSIDSWFNDNYLFTPITKIEKKKYNGKVYNLEIDNTHSFISEAFCLHNCGDIMKVYLKVEKNKLKDVKFQTFGCVSAIAASDALCELAKGKTIEEAKKITNNAIVDKLEGLPAIKVHCSVLGANGLKKAILDYESKNGKKVSKEELKKLDSEAEEEHHHSHK
jgi:nitrogen fixation protein NifU and related proteins